MKDRATDVFEFADHADAAERPGTDSSPFLPIYCLLVIMVENKEKKQKKQMLLTDKLRTKAKAEGTLRTHLEP